MELGFIFFFNSILQGAGLAMDAFSVSLANGLNEPCMKKRKMFGIAGIFATFQALMPLTGWVCIHTIASHFKTFEKLIPWIALALLSFIGINMILESIKSSDCPEKCTVGVDLGTVIVQGIATSIDALSVGLTISDYDLSAAILSALLIAAVTFIICTAGLIVGRKSGTALSGKAGILGGGILIFIGLEIFITSWF